MEQINNANLQQALFYDEKLNWSVIPVALNKKPLVEWKEYQTRRPTIEEITAWFEKYPNANIGIVTGRISNLIVVDIDPRNGGTDQDFNHIITVKSKTGGNGLHYYFLYEDGFDSHTGIRPGIDIQSDGKYVVVPPSVHISGKKYEWMMSPQAGTPITPLPSFIKNWNKSEKPILNESNWNPKVLKGVGKGNRNESASSVIGKLLVRFPPHEWESDAWSLTLGWNELNKPPLLLAELRDVFESISSRELARRQNNKYSIPPEDTLGLTVAETNTEPSIITWEEFVSVTDEGQEPWIVKNLIRPGWLGVLGGHGKHGKSTLAFHMLTALRRGSTFINSCQKVPVIYINCEMAPEDVRGLIKAVTGTTNQEQEQAQIINQPHLPLQLPWLEKTLLSQQKPGVCLIDSFRAAFLLASDTENQAGTVGGILRRLQNIARKTKWTIIVIHHFRKSGTGEALDLAGSGEWLSAPDVIFTWHCPNPKEPGTLTAVGRIPPVEPLSLRLSRETIDFLGTVSEQTAEAEKQKVLDALKEEEWQKSGEVAKTVELSEGTVRRRLAELYEETLAERQGEGKKGNPFLWKRKLVGQDEKFDSDTKILSEAVGGNESLNIKKVESILSSVCYTCGGTKLWKTKDGSINCVTCHPPTSEEDVKEWIGAEGA